MEDPCFVGSPQVLPKVVLPSYLPSPHLPRYRCLGAQTTSSLTLQITLMVGLLTRALTLPGRFSFEILIDVGPAFVRLSPTGKTDKEQIKTQINLK